MKFKKVLITVDKVNIQTWKDQIFFHSDYSVMDCYTKGYGLFTPLMNKGTFCFLVSYTKIKYPPLVDFVFKIGFDAWIIDEANELKHWNTKKTKDALVFAPHIPNKLVMTAFPFTEYLHEAWIYFFLFYGYKQISSCLHYFLRKYFFAQKGIKIPKPSCATNMIKELSKFIYWKPKIENIKLPKKKYIKIEVPFTKQLKEIDDKLREEYVLSFEKELDIELNYAASVFIKRIQLTSGIVRGTNDKEIFLLPSNKLIAIQKILEKHKEEKIVIWHKFIYDTVILETFLKNLKIPYFLFDISCNNNILLDYQQVKKGILLIRSSYCKGLNTLADGNIVVFYSNGFSYNQRIQAEGRSRRITSVQDVTYYYDITTKGGADDVVYNQLKNKQSVVLTAQFLIEQYAKEEGGKYGTQLREHLFQKPKHIKRNQEDSKGK